jgi:hypothetical protein
VNIWGVIWPLVLIAFGIWTLLGSVFRKTPQTERANVPLEGASRARVRLAHGAGRLHVGAGAQDGDLLEGDFGGGVELEQHRSGDQLDVRLAVPVQFIPFGPGSALNWDVRIHPNLPLTLEIDGGANEARLDLSELQVTDLFLKSGASSSEVILPANAGNTRVQVESGAASVTVQVPQNVAARIRWSGGLSSIQVDTLRFHKMGDLYQSPDYDTAANRADISVQMGVGSVNIR